MWQMKARWILSTMMAVTFVALSVAAYLALLGPIAGDKVANRLRLAINPWPGYEVLYLAHIRDLYRQQGLEVDLVQFSTLDDARRSFERGQVDAVATTLVDVMQIYQGTGERPVVVLVTDYSDGADVIIARGEGIRSPRDLKGKRVAVEQMFGRFVLQVALEKSGLSLEDVRLVEASGLEGPDLLKAREVDAVVTYAPQSVSAARVPGARTIFTSSETPGKILDVVAVRPGVLDEIPDLRARLARAWGQSLQVMRDYPGEAIRIMARREGLSDDEFRQALKGVHLVPEAEQLEMLRIGGPVEQGLERLAGFKGWSSPVARPQPDASTFLAPVTELGTAN